MDGSAVAKKLRRLERCETPEYSSGEVPVVSLDLLCTLLQREECLSLFVVFSLGVDRGHGSTMFFDGSWVSHAPEAALYLLSKEFMAGTTFDGPSCTAC